jgi:hypothetical protein
MIPDRRVAKSRKPEAVSQQDSEGETAHYKEEIAAGG